MTAEQDRADEARRKREEMEAIAVRADIDTEDKLILVERMLAEMRVDAGLKARYESLRNQLVAQLKREGPRYFIDDEGRKRYAYAVVPETVEVDVAELERLAEEGKLSEEVLDQVAPRKLDRENFRKAVAAKRIDPKTVAKIAQIRPKGSGHVAFSKPLDEEDDGE